MLTPIAMKRDEARDANSGQRIYVEKEVSWRSCTIHDHNSHPTLAIGHWLGGNSTSRELTAPILEEHYTIEVLCERTHVSYVRDGNVIYSGPTDIGAIQVTAPNSEVRCTFSRPTSAVHIFVPERLIGKLYEDFTERGLCAALKLRDPAFSSLGNVGALAFALADVGNLSGPCARLWLESLTLAIMARVIDLKDHSTDPRSGSGGLTRWRQRLAIEFIDTNLAESISLRDIAGHVGLSRMHFALQFKISMGISPHLYVINRRLAKAKELLSGGNVSVLEVAFEVGFRSQSHFCVAFKRFTGLTPTEWRAQRKGALSLNIPYDLNRQFT